MSLFGLTYYIWSVRVAQRVQCDGLLCATSMIYNSVCAGRMSYRVSVLSGLCPALALGELFTLDHHHMITKWGRILGMWTDLMGLPALDRHYVVMCLNSFSGGTSGARQWGCNCQVCFIFPTLKWPAVNQAALSPSLYEHPHVWP